MKEQKFNVTWNHVDPDPLWIDFQNVHFPIFDNLAFFYRLFSWDRPEEWVQEQLFPYLMTAKDNWMNKKNGVTTPDNTVRTGVPSCLTTL